MARVFMKGCEAIAEAAVRSGCRFFAGYPITPQNEIPEYMSRRMPEVGGVFVQGESEVASINMIFGAAQTGTRAMTSSSSCGISLMSEGLSFLAGARVPMVVVNVQRGGPGIGAIQPAQQDYLQATKASGNGGFQMMVLAPSTVQEAVDMTFAAFDYAQRDRNPVMVLADGVIGTIMEPVTLPEARSSEQVAELKASCRSWALVGHDLSCEPRALVDSGDWDTKGMEQKNIEASALYESWKKDAQAEELFLDDAEVVVAAYGISGRIARSAVSLLRQEGLKVGLIRPKTVNPFPFESFDKLDYHRVKAILDVEMSIPAQMLYDVRMAVRGRCGISTCLHSGGEILGRHEIMDSVRGLFK
ncbi:MAG: 3-methyl-2-oxobutanoate dehydrogenase subunit VorB [Oscillospiraceae bacterium]|nr:3-methyl-2-oxobutanoate dehydrogenase subunit VorB [Oscillospiraceae bacterium]